MAVSLNWSDPAHWSPSRRACVHCGSLTNLRDAAGRPAHKVCVERLVDQLRRLDARTVAFMLDVSTTRIDQLARAERIPSMLHNRRRWFRRSHIEQIAAARALRRSLG